MEERRKEKMDACDHDRYSLGLLNVTNTCHIVHLFLHLRMNVLRGIEKPQSLFLYKYVPSTSCVGNFILVMMFSLMHP